MPVHYLASVMFLALLCALPAHAQQWSEFAYISGTMGVQDGHLCLGEASRGELGCPTYAPSVNPANGNVGIGTENPMAQLHVYRSASDTNAGVIIHSLDRNADVNLVSKPSGLTSIYFRNMDSTNTTNQASVQYAPALGMIKIAISNTAVLSLVSSGYAGIGTQAPTAMWDVRGTMRIAAGAENCDANRTGAIKYQSGDFFYCRNGTAWESLTSLVSGTQVAFRATRNNVHQTGLMAGQWNQIALTTKEFDTTNAFDLATGRFQPTIAGYYLLAGMVTCNNATECYGDFFKNGQQLHTGGGTSTATTIRANLSSFTYLNGSTDYITFHVWPIGGTVVNGNRTFTYFSAILINGLGTQAGSSGNATTLSGLTDVNLNAPSTGQVLTYNGSSWVNSAASTGLPDSIVSGTTGMYTYTTGKASIATGGTERIVINSTGLIGIGQQPQADAMLAISGTTRSTIVQLTNNPANLCDGTAVNSIKTINGKIYICRQ